MTGFILGEKSEQTQLMTPEGERIPVTFIKTNPCYLVCIKDQVKPDYISIALGFGQAKKNGKSVQGQFKKAGISTPLRFIRQFRLKKLTTAPVISMNDQKQKTVQIDEVTLTTGQEIKPETMFKVGQLVNVSGTSKGKGFQGVVKRHGFRGGPRTHGQSDRERGPGSIGQTTTPGRVYKGKRMAGRMGGEQITVENLKVIEIKENGFYIKGLIPGSKSGLVRVIGS